MSHPEKVVDSGVQPVDISDHDLVYCVTSDKPTRPSAKHVKTRNWKNFKDENFCKDCTKFPFRGLFTASSVDIAWDIFKTFVNEVTNSHAPLRERRVRGQDIPWITQELRDQMHLRDHLRKLSKRLKTSTAVRKYKNQRKRTRKCLNEAKKISL